MKQMAVVGDESYYSKSEMKELLIASLMFSSSNKGLTKIKGCNFGEQADTMIEALEVKTEGQSILSIINKFR